MPREVIIEHPNRGKASTRTTRAIVILLLVASAALFTIVTVGGWSTLVGAQGVAIFYIAVYLVMAYYAGRWNRGVLPVAAALAIVMLIFAVVATPAWFTRDKTGFADPALPSTLLGTITAIIVPVQVLLIAFAMRGFSQGWHVEVERRVDDPRRGALPASS